ncbi:MAG: hypothetical protein HY246_21465 [Proteobacteria bacterium]|nr:hypothetical protein [Pseudomonadota bacterium]
MAVNKGSASCACASQAGPVCTLGPAEFRQQLAHIRDLTGRALRARNRNGLQLRLGYDAGAAAEVRELVDMERVCCNFLDFQLEEQGDILLLTVTAPAAAKASVEEIFSEFAG